jgi:hypothetical protein
MNNQRPVFTKTLFWDCHYHRINYDKESRFVIERVLTRGTDSDEKKLFAYYGSEKIKQTVLELRYLDKKTLNYLSIIFNIPQEQFRCYKNTPSKDPFGRF